MFKIKDTPTGATMLLYPLEINYLLSTSEDCQRGQSFTDFPPPNIFSNN